jgi:hypothetical protein
MWVVGPNVRLQVHQIYEKAYRACGCPGNVAAESTWVSLFYAANAADKFSGCKEVTQSVLKYSRCGAGF